MTKVLTRGLMGLARAGLQQRSVFLGRQAASKHLEGGGAGRAGGWSLGTDSRWRALLPGV